ncbi:hypothetical protein EA002_21170, partial [Vibrio anguillarum]|nr:hypothetical protein [Vibrio anguillarum]
MSTQEVAELINSVNEMTQTVADKNKEIDAKVNAATSAVPDKIKSEMEQVLWVDSVTGNDSNSGLSSSSPKRTIKSAIDVVPIGGHVRVKLMGQNVYEIHDDIHCEGKFILITSDGAVWGAPATRSTIRSAQVGWSSYKCGQFKTGYAAEIQIGQVN